MLFETVAQQTTHPLKQTPSHSNDKYYTRTASSFSINTPTELKESFWSHFRPGLSSNSTKITHLQRTQARLFVSPNFIVTSWVNKTSASVTFGLNFHVFRLPSINHERWIESPNLFPHHTRARRKKQSNDNGTVFFRTQTTHDGRERKVNTCVVGTLIKYSHTHKSKSHQRTKNNDLTLRHK